MPINYPKGLLDPIPFDQVDMDMVGHLEKSVVRHQYTLVTMLRTPLHAAKLFQSSWNLFSQVGISQEIFTDQIMQDLYCLMKIKLLRTSVQHPEMGGLVERFNPEGDAKMICGH